MATAYLIVLQACLLPLYIREAFSITRLCSQGVSNKINQALLEAINATGQAFLIGTELDGRFSLRMAIGAAGTQSSHVADAWQLIALQADAILTQTKQQ